VNILREAIKRREQELRSTAVDIEDLRKRAARLKRKESAALSAMLDPDLAAERAVIKEQYRTASEERRRIESELTLLERAGGTPAGDWVEETVRMIREFIRTLVAAELRQEFVRRLVSRAEWNGEEIRMECFIEPKLAQTSS
jgi:hypothetical protein